MTKRSIVTMAAAFVMVMTLTAATRADLVTIHFDPDAIIQLYPAAPGGDVPGGGKVDQLDARRVHQIWKTASLHETFYDPAAPKPQPDSYNTYMNWRDSLGPGEGIAMFNSWFLDNGAARAWGETVVVKPGTEVVGTAADGWNVRIIEEPYGLGGASVQWWTTDPTKYINTVSSIDEFSITADLYWDINGNGWDATDTPVAAGESVRFWVGGLNGDDAEFYLDGTQAVYFDNQGWGNRSPYASAPFSALYSAGPGIYGSGFEAALEATVVPVPAAALLGLLGLSVAGTRLRRRA